MKKTLSETSVQFADALQSEAVRGGNAYTEERTKRVFIDGFPANIQSAVRIFWSRDLCTHLLEIAQCTNALPEQTRQVPNPVVAPVQRNRFQRCHRAATIVATGAEPRFRSPKEIHDFRQTRRQKSPFSEGGYGNDYRTQQATHCRVCFAKAHRMETFLYTVRSGKVAQKREANYKQMISYEFWGNNCR